MAAKRAPQGLDKPGRKLWNSVVSEFELAEHEAAQLEEACRTRDTINALRVRLAGDGLMLASPQGKRLHPAVGEIRQQQLVLARLLATLNVPALEDDELPPSKGVRGVYGMRVAS